MSGNVKNMHQLTEEVLVLTSTFDIGEELIVLGEISQLPVFFLSIYSERFRVRQSWTDELQSRNQRSNCALYAWVMGHTLEKVQYLGHSLAKG